MNATIDQPEVAEPPQTNSPNKQSIDEMIAEANVEAQSERGKVEVDFETPGRAYVRVLVRQVQSQSRVPAKGGGSISSRYYDEFQIRREITYYL